MIQAPTCDRRDVTAGRSVGLSTHERQTDTQMPDLVPDALKAASGGL